MGSYGGVHVQDLFSYPDLTKEKGQSYLLSFKGLKGHLSVLSVLSACIMNGMLLILTVTYCATRLGGLGARAAIMFTTFCSLVESPCRLHTERLTNQWLWLESLTCAV